MTQVEPFSPRRARRRANEQQPGSSSDPAGRGYSPSASEDPYEQSGQGSQPGPRPYTNPQPPVEQYPGQYAGRYGSPASPSEQQYGQPQGGQYAPRDRGPLYPQGAERTQPVQPPQPGRRPSQYPQDRGGAQDPRAAQYPQSRSSAQYPQDPGGAQDPRMAPDARAAQYPQSRGGTQYPQDPSSAQDPRTAQYPQSRGGTQYPQEPTGAQDPRMAPDGRGVQYPQSRSGAEAGQDPRAAQSPQGRGGAQAGPYPAAGQYQPARDARPEPRGPQYAPDARGPQYTPEPRGPQYAPDPRMAQYPGDPEVAQYPQDRAAHDPRAQYPPDSRPAYPGQGQLSSLSQQSYAPAPTYPPAPDQPQPYQPQPYAPQDRGYEQPAYAPAGPPPPASPPPTRRRAQERTRARTEQRAQPPSTPPPGSAEDQRRGSHATPAGQGFSWVVLWTIAGAVLPGSGLIAAGWRRLGGLLLFLLVLAGVALAGTVLLGNSINHAISLAVDPRKLLILAMIVVAGAVVWAGVILLTNTQLRRYATLTRGQRSFSTLVVLALIAGVGLPAYEVSHYALIQRDLVNSVFKTGTGDKEGRPDAGASDPWADKPRENVLLIGSDAGADRVGVRPDTLILASMNTKSGDTVLFSLPRNLERVPFAEGSGGAQAWPNGFYCPEQGSGHDCLLNAVWQWGATAGKQYYKDSKNPGLQATEDAVEGVTGLRPDTYAMLNLKGFQDFIDAIGGLKLNVTERLPIGGNSEHPVATHGYIEPGEQKLNGFKSLWYARSRWSTNDYDRMRRQRCVIGAVVQQSDPGKLAKAFPSIAKAAKTNLSTGIPREDLEAWVELTQKVKGASVRSLPFTDQVVPDRANPDFDNIRELVAKALKPPKKATPDPSASAGTPEKKKKKTVVDPSKAQDISDVC